MIDFQYKLLMNKTGRFFSQQKESKQTSKKVLLLALNSMIFVLNFII